VITTSRVDGVTVVKSTTRQDRAAATRGRILDAGYRLFCEHGYRATTMQSIAEHAGVAVQTVYFTFHTKEELLQEITDREVVGDERVPPHQSAWADNVRAEPDSQVAVGILVDAVADIIRRVAPLIPVFHTVSGDAAGEIFRLSEQRRRRGYRTIVDELLGKAAPRGGLTAERATDVVFVLLGPETYRTFVIDLGWSHDDWARWVSGALVRELFDR
jgi:AcrR family transcriptional regulator